MPNFEEVVIWDPIVRLFHWTVASCFLLNFFVTEEGETLHNWLGYIVLVLISIRIIWGFISFGFKGSSNARFRNFWPTKKGVHEHLISVQFGNLDQHEGHNPAGALMIITMLVLLSLLGLSGYLLKNVDYFFGSDFMQGLHGLLANLTMIAVAIHISAVVVIQKWTGVELVKPMLKGKRKINKA